jgi:homoserine dehydrogenase
MTEPVQIAIVGLGTVGTGVARILTDRADRIHRAAGRPLQIKHVIVRNPEKPRDIALRSDIVSDQLGRVLDDKDVSIVAQLIGGVEPARQIMEQLLESGKDVVTANKALLAEHGQTLFEIARKRGRAIAFEASVAGGVPIIAGIGQSLSANQITSLSGILNGTSNFIVSQMERNNASYDDSVREAQQRGFAEADPTMDVDGTDAAQKLAILAQLAFGADVDWKSIPRVGIDALQQPDMHYAAELGYRIKLLSLAQMSRIDQTAGLDLHVSPTLVRVGTPLAEVRGAHNAISVVGDVVGRVFFHGLGAGPMPTASAVVADLVDMALGRAQITFGALDLWSSGAERVVPRDPRLAPGRYYLRIRVVDHPGVLAEVAGKLAAHDISIASVIQHEPASATSGEPFDVDLVIMTHNTTEGSIDNAIRQMTQLTSVRLAPVKMRVLD